MKNNFSAALKKFGKLHAGVKITLILFFLFFLVEAVIHIFPFLWVINNSLKVADEYYENPMALTNTWQFANYLKVFTEFRVEGSVGYGEMFFNSCWQTFDRH